MSFVHCVFENGGVPDLNPDPDDKTPAKGRRTKIKYKVTRGALTARQLAQLKAEKKASCALAKKVEEAKT